MGGDINLVIQWWGTLFLVGSAAYPLTKGLFKGWWDKGYLFAKAIGMATAAYLVYLLGTLHILPFSTQSIFVALGLVFILGVLLTLKVDPKGNRGNNGINLKFLFVPFLEEIFFFVALLFWSWIKGHEPSIHNLEKFMDFGFTKSILNSYYFPAPDMWYSGGVINYYHFGHIVMAVLTKLSGLDLRYTFNLMLATLFGLTLTMSFGIGYQLANLANWTNWKKIITGALTAFLVTLCGNLQTIYAFTKGYTGDDVKPLWQLFWPLAEFWQKLPEGLNRYWYANATRFIPFTIHEFPSYSFVVSDVHGHVLSLPFVLLAIGLLIIIYRHLELQRNFQFSIFNFQTIYKFKFSNIKNLFQISSFKFQILFYGFVVAVLLMTNALDGPIYLALLLVLLSAVNWSNWTDWSNWIKKAKIAAVVSMIALISSLPFLWHFKSFVSGLAINCPPAFLANSKIGPFIFEGVEKCQHSPTWMMLLLWGFFLYCGIWMVIKNVKCQMSNVKFKFKIQLTQVMFIERLLIILFLFSIALIIFPEFLYFKDIYPMHFRSNTMFKLGYQAFILFSIVSGYTITNFLFMTTPRIMNYELRIMKKKKSIFLIGLMPLLFLVSIYPIFSVRSYFDSLRTYRGLDGLVWLGEQYPGDYQAIEWLNRKSSQPSAISRQPDRFAIVEADGDSYTDYCRFSAFTGLPTIIGWPVHEWLWRGSYDIVSPRREDVRLIYESSDIYQTREILKRYQVKYVVIGFLERIKFKNLNEAKISNLGKRAFRAGDTVIYEMMSAK